MSISSSLANKYDEFDEFPHQATPQSAYKELKAWCEKYLSKNGYSIFTPVGDKTLTAIHITDDALCSQFYFKTATGEYYGGEEMP